MMLLWMLGLISTGRAAHPAAAAEALLPQAPGLVLSCTPMDIPLAGFSRMAALPAIADDPDFQRFALLIRPDSLDAAGVNLSGTITSWLDSDGVHVQLPTRGAGTHPALVERLFADATLSGSGPWEATSEDGDVFHIETGADGASLVIHDANNASPVEDADALPALLAGIPDDAPGCLIYLPRLPAKEVTERKIAMPAGLSAWFPFEDGPMHLRVQASEALKVPLHGDVAPPAVASTARTPLMRMSLGVPLLPLLFAPDAPWAEERPGDLELADIERRVWLPGGLSVALYNLDRENPDIALVVPVQNRRRKDASPRQLRRLVKKLPDEELVWTSRETFTRSGERPMFGGLEEGRVVLASTAQTRDELMAGDGAPWFSPAAAARAEAWPLYAEMAHPMLAGTVLAVGVSAEPETGTVALGVETPGKPLRQLLAQASAMAGPIFAKNLEEMMARRDRSVEVTEMLTALCDDQLAEGGPAALPVAPRAAADLSQQPVPWSTPPLWSAALAGGAYEAPRAGEPLYGAYWVEVSADGQQATALGAIITAPDGTQASHYRMVCGVDAAPQLIE